MEASRLVPPIFWNGMVPHLGDIFLFWCFFLILNQTQKIEPSHSLPPKSRNLISFHFQHRKLGNMEVPSPKKNPITFAGEG
jgi:hypothetical protein